MGDGGVAFMPLQQYIMERCSIAEKTLCGGKNENGFSSKSLNFADTSRKKKMKAKKEELAKKGETEKGELGSDGVGKGSREIENAETCIEKVHKEEVEEGELGTLKWPKGDVENGEFVPEKSVRSEIEKGEIVSERRRKGEVERGDSVSRKWRREDVEKGEIVHGKGGRGFPEKGELGAGRSSKIELEKGEFIPDRRHRGEGSKEDQGYGRVRRYQPCKEKSWRSECERTPPSGRYLVDDLCQRKDARRSGSQHGKIASRWESGLERNVRISSKIVDEEGLYKNEHANGKSHGRDYFSGNRLKRYGNDSESIERKHYGDYGDYTSSKCRRLSDDSNRTVHSEHYSRRSVERSHRNSSSKIPADKYPSRHHESPISSRAIYDRYGRSPRHSEQSPRDRARYYDHRDWTPVRRERSPYSRNSDRSRHYDHRNKSPACAEQSPQDKSRPHDPSIPNCVELATLDCSRQNNHRDTIQKSESIEKHDSQDNNKAHEDEHLEMDLNALAEVPHSRSGIYDTDLSVEKNVSCEPPKEGQSKSASMEQKVESPLVETTAEELPSMEEDMDICDTPPHVPAVSDSSSGKWIYLDYCGVECGPSKLCELKTLVDEGRLPLDHFIKHLESDRWVTVENAVSPFATVSFPSIVSDTITQMVNPPEAPGNLLAEAVDTPQTGSESCLEVCIALPQLMACPDGSPILNEPLEDLHIDERVGALLEGYDVSAGKELEIIGEVLQMSFESAWLERLGNWEGYNWQEASRNEDCDSRACEAVRDSESQSSAPSDKENGFAFGVSADWFSGLWSCKGGDWRRTDDVAQDRSARKKLVLNDGFPLCLMPKSGYEDPRWHQKDDWYYPSHNRRLDLPPWAFTSSDERGDFSGVSRTFPNKPPPIRGVKGTVLPVVRINACVVKDHGSFISEPRNKSRGKDRYLKSSRPCSSSHDSKKLLAEDDLLSKTTNNHGSQGSFRRMEFLNIPKDRLRTVDDLQLHLGDWYYLDGSGREQGPLSFSGLQGLVDQGIIKTYSSVFRKIDKLWVPVTTAVDNADANVNFHQQNFSASGESSGNLQRENQGDYVGINYPSSSLFHKLHPQFIGFTRGKLHELVMKSYKSREFAAAINEVLDPWINARLPKKESEKLMYWKSEGDLRSTKRVRMLTNNSEEDDEMFLARETVHNNEFTFEELCGNATFHTEEGANTDSDLGSWGLLDGHVLARVFHFLRCDIKSLVYASLTCKHWRTTIKFYKGISRQVDLSSLGHTCSDSTLYGIVNAYDKEKINSITLVGCTSISSEMLEKVVHSFPGLLNIDIRGCNQFGELVNRFTNLRWIKSRISHGTKTSEESHSKTRSLKQITEQTSSTPKPSSLGGDMDDFGELKDYFDSVDKRDSAKQLFRRSLYKRSKLYDARRSSSILSRDARTRRWAIKKSENGYKKIEEYMSSSLKNIMKTNTFDFFVPKVAEIEDKMKIGYYRTRGLRSFKDDIRRMCRDAIKAKNRGDAGNMNHIITLFIQLATRLDQNSNSLHERDALLKSWEEDSSAGFSSSSLKDRKKLNKFVNERKYNKSCAASSINGSLESGEDASDREIRRRLFKLNKKSMGSESETSDDLDVSSEDGKSESDSTASETESDLESQAESRAGDPSVDGCSTLADGLDLMADDREWGARMTKASLVPPVTRKYEVIDQYVIVADEVDVLRKMQVSLPDDYAELRQKMGIEESDMELPEVKDYKPRKLLGDEVIEQEVYGIDPYTHNLLLDSMPQEDFSLLDKQSFIEDFLLCTLNKQVRHFTGSGNTPMMYPLQPVIEEIKRTAEDNHNTHTAKMCQCVLKAIISRPDDKYVAYRKGLGVVCNKKDGFGEDDFVVEFLGEVYPVWKWFEKQDGIRSLQKSSKDPAPEFYNIYLERPKGDADGYDLVVVDAMHKANYASRICHSCKPNCEAKVTAVDGRYQIGIYTLRPIQYGEEITFDYNSVTESKEEYEASVCLCGNQLCRGSYLNLTGEGAFQKVLKDCHGILDRHHLMLEACELNSVSEEDYNDLLRAGLGSCLLGGLPDWVVSYSARLVRFINFERTKLPEEILRHNLAEKKKYFLDIDLNVEKSDAELQAEGVYNQRLQNLAVTLDKVRYVMRCVFGDPRRAPPPLEKLSPEATVSFLWEGKGSFVQELLQCMAPHVEEDTLNDLKSKVHARNPSGSEDIRKELQKSLLWLRDEVRNLPCTYKSRHDAAADLIHIYAYTNCFFRIWEYEAVTSPPVYISPLDLGPKCADKLGAGFQEYCKTYGENYCLAQLIFWHNQSNAEPDCILARASRGCLSLPDISSFYAKVQKPSRHRVYGPRTVRSMVARMEKQPQRPWPRDRIWLFKTSPEVLGSPMLDAVMSNSPLDREMVHWLKHRPAIFQAMWDR